MVTTSFTAAAFAALLPAAAPSWQTDYATALAAAAAEQKPVAVFIGNGASGYAKLVSDGQIPAEAGRVLASSYVCVYVDTDTAAGKKLAGQFAIDSGLVISNRGGSLQALRHTGTVTPAQLTNLVNQYSSEAVAAGLAQDKDKEKDKEPKDKAPATGIVCVGGSCGVPYYHGGYVGGCVGGSCGVPYSSGCSTGGCGSYAYCGSSCNSGCGSRSYGCSTGGCGRRGRCR